MLQTITSREIHEAAKEYANQNTDKDWQEAVNVFNFMSEFLNKQKDKKVTFDENKLIAIDNGVEVLLTRKEYSLALYLYNNVNRVVTREEILDDLWGCSELLTRTVDVHIRHLRVKLPNANIKTVKFFGYIWIEDDNI